MDADREKDPIDPAPEPDTSTAAEPDSAADGSGAGIDAEDRPAMREDDGVQDTPV